MLLGRRLRYCISLFASDGSRIGTPFPRKGGYSGPGSPHGDATRDSLPDFGR
jgi:hypothetical protein